MSDGQIKYNIGLRARFRGWRRAIKNKMPYVRRRVYTRSLHKYELLTEELGMGARGASDARITVLKEAPAGQADDLCLFLSFQPGPTLKPHVLTHVTALLDRGVRVVLILNAVMQPSELQLDPSLVERLDGVYVRENIGYDFAGWAQVYGIISPQLRVRRLFLVNDSIIGPLKGEDFDAVLSRIRSSRADMIGLTEAMEPRPHLQSFFLVFNERVLHEAVAPFFQQVLSFVDKSTVIDVYETRLTQRLRGAGWRCEPVFAPLNRSPQGSNDPYYLWNELIEAGFPYLKVSVMHENIDHPTVRRLIAPTVVQATLGRP